MKKQTSTILILLVSACVAVTSTPANAATSSQSKKALAEARAAKERKAIADAQIKKAIASATLKDSSSLYDSSRTQYVPNKLGFDFGPKSQNFKYDSRMIAAAQIAADRARAHSTSRCWHAVKNALVAANVISSRPTTEYAKQAGDELQNKYGFKKLAIKDPFAAPIGSVLVYGGKGAGHVEIRTPRGFASDFTTDKPSRRPLIGVYVKPS